MKYTLQDNEGPVANLVGFTTLLWVFVVVKVVLEGPFEGSTLVMALVFVFVIAMLLIKLVERALLGATERSSRPDLMDLMACSQSFDGISLRPIVQSRKGSISALMQTAVPRRIAEQCCLISRFHVLVSR